MDIKQKLILTATALITSISLQMSGAEHIRILQKDRMWVLSNQPSHIHDDFAPASVAKVGTDTIVEGRNCVNIDITTLSLNGLHKSKQTVCEEDGRLWWWNNSYARFQLLIDMNAEDGDIIPMYYNEKSSEEIGTLVVKAVGDVDIWDGPRKVLALYCEESSCPLTYWVEGIGSTDNIYETMFPVHMGDATYLTQCFNDGKWECFNLRQFEMKLLDLPQTGLEMTSEAVADSGDVIHDLNGLHIEVPAKGTIYVKNRALHLQN